MSEFVEDEDYDDSSFSASESEDAWDMPSSPRRPAPKQPQRARAISSHPSARVPAFEPVLPVQAGYYWGPAYPMGQSDDPALANYWARNPPTAYQQVITSAPPSAFFLQPMTAESHRLPSAYGYHSHPMLRSEPPRMVPLPATAIPDSYMYDYTVQGCGQYDPLQSPYIDDQHFQTLDMHPVEVPLPDSFDNEPPSGRFTAGSFADNDLLTPEETPELASTQACPPSIAPDLCSEQGDMLVVMRSPPVAECTKWSLAQSQSYAAGFHETKDSVSTSPSIELKGQTTAQTAAVSDGAGASAMPEAGTAATGDATFSPTAEEVAALTAKGSVNNITKGPSYLPPSDGNLNWVLLGATEHARRLRALRVLLRPDCSLDEVGDLLAVGDVPPSLLLPRALFPGMSVMQFFPFKPAPEPIGYVPLSRKPANSQAPELYVSWPREHKEPAAKGPRIRKAVVPSLDFVPPEGLEPAVNMEAHLVRVISTGSMPWDPSHIMYPLGFIRYSEWMPVTALPASLLPEWDEEKFFNIPEQKDSEHRPTVFSEEVDGDMELNMYNPPYSRRTGPKDNECYCGMCDSWHRRNSSHWLHHMKTVHGIRASTKLPYQLPHLVANRPDRPRKSGFFIGFCDACQSWQGLNCSNNRTGLASWFLHQAAHDVSRNKDRQKTYKRSGADMVPVAQYTSLLYSFYERRRTVLNMQRIISDEIKENGDVGQFGGAVFQMPYYLRAMGSLQDIDPSMEEGEASSVPGAHARAMDCIDKASCLVFERNAAAAQSRKTRAKPKPKAGANSKAKTGDETDTESDSTEPSPDSPDSPDSPGSPNSEHDTEHDSSETDSQTETKTEKCAEGGAAEPKATATAKPKAKPASKPKSKTEASARAPAEPAKPKAKAKAPAKAAKPNAKLKGFRIQCFDGYSTQFKTQYAEAQKALKAQQGKTKRGRPKKKKKELDGEFTG